MAGLVRAVSLLARERCVVHQHIRLVRGLEDRAGGPRVTGHHHLSPGPRWPEHLLRHNSDPSGELDRIAPLEHTEQRPLRYAERERGVSIEAARPRLLDERVSLGQNAVARLEHDDPVVASSQGIPGLKLDELEREGQPSEDPLESAHEILQPRRAVNRQRQLPAAKGEGLQHPGEAEVVISVIVGEKDGRNLDQADARTQELPLRTLATVDEKPLATPADERARGSPPRARYRPRRAEENEVQIH